MTWHNRQAQLALRRIALVLALACLWMSSGATLRHTDDLSAFQTFAAGQVAWGHTTPTVAAVPCAAHEWMNAWQTLHAVRPSVTHCFAPMAALRETPPAILHLRGFDYVSLRGPPFLLS